MCDGPSQGGPEPAPHPSHHLTLASDHPIQECTVDPDGTLRGCPIDYWQDVYGRVAHAAAARPRSAPHRCMDRSWSLPAAALCSLPGCFKCVDGRCEWDEYKYSGFGSDEYKMYCIHGDYQ